MLRQALIVLMCHTLATYCQDWNSSDLWDHADRTADSSVVQQAETASVLTKLIPAHIITPHFFPALPSAQRRLLSSSQNRKVAFVLSGGNQATFKQLWPNATFTSGGGSSTTVVLNSNNIELTIEDVKVKLTSLKNDTTVQVQPYGVKSGTLVFVLNTVNKTLVQTLWPNAVLVISDKNITVKLATGDDPEWDLRALRIKLLQLANIIVLVDPYFIPDPPAENQDQNLIIGIIIGVVLLFCFIGWFFFCRTESRKEGTGYDPVNSNSPPHSSFPMPPITNVVNAPKPAAIIGA